MSPSTASTPIKRQRGEPAWEIAYLFPTQGEWSESEYLSLNSNHLVEFSDGMIEVLPMPTTDHQRIVAFLYGLVLSFVSVRKLGEVLFAPLRVRLWAGKYREPDVVFMLAEHSARVKKKYWEGADLLVEIVSEDPESQKRDWEDKRADYERAGIPEYWVVDPQKGLITVLALSQGRYAVHTEGRAGQRVSSALLAGFELDVDAVLAAGQI
jgi:Uma2 family endonuclease